MKSAVKRDKDSEYDSVKGIDVETEFERAARGSAKRKEDRPTLMGTWHNGLVENGAGRLIGR